jgi:hypothetical protein
MYNPVDIYINTICDLHTRNNEANKRSTKEAKHKIPFLTKPLNT